MKIRLDFYGIKKKKNNYIVVVIIIVFVVGTWFELANRSID